MNLLVAGLAQEAAETAERNLRGVIVWFGAGLGPEWPWCDGGVGAVFAAFVVSSENALIGRNPLSDVTRLCIA